MSVPDKKQLNKRNQIFVLESAIRSDSRLPVSLLDLKETVFFWLLPKTVTSRIIKADEFLSKSGAENIRFGFVIKRNCNNINPEISGGFVIYEIDGLHFFMTCGRFFKNFTCKVYCDNERMHSGKKNVLEESFNIAIKELAKKTK